MKKKRIKKSKRRITTKEKKKINKITFNNRNIRKK